MGSLPSLTCPEMAEVVICAKADTAAIMLMKTATMTPRNDVSVFFLA
jgi:hypothetical protein